MLIVAVAAACIAGFVGSLLVLAALRDGGSDEPLAQPLQFELVPDNVLSPSGSRRAEVRLERVPDVVSVDTEIVSNDSDGRPNPTFIIVVRSDRASLDSDLTEIVPGILIGPHQLESTQSARSRVLGVLCDHSQLGAGAYFRIDSTPPDRQHVIDLIASHDAVVEWKYLDEHAAYLDFVETFRDQPDVRDALHEGEVPTSVQFVVRSFEQAGPLIERIEAFDVVLNAEVAGCRGE